MNTIMEDNEQSRLKELCKVARKKLGYSNQDIADRIAEKFDLPEYSVNTVNNFFSERSKAATIYTAGYICSVLDVSIDEVFSITRELTDAERSQLDNLKRELESSSKLINEKDERLQQAHKALDHYRQAANEDRKRVPSWAFNTLLLVVVILVAIIAIYLVVFDLHNSSYGLFH